VASADEAITAYSPIRSPAIVQAIKAALDVVPITKDGMATDTLTGRLNNTFAVRFTHAFVPIYTETCRPVISYRESKVKLAKPYTSPFLFLLS
jgi:hypothetical protein